MTNNELNISVILKFSLRKAFVHRGCSYDFGSLITRVCHFVGVTKESLDYMAPQFLMPVNVTKTKGHNNEFCTTLTTAEWHRCNELNMAHMYGLEMLRYKNRCRAFSSEQIREVEINIL